MSMYEILEETEQKQETKQEGTVDYIVLLVDSLQEYGKRCYDITMLGESMYNWVVRACNSKPTLVSYNEEDDLLATIRPMLKNGEYTVVLYSDTPLITANGLKQMVDFAQNKNLSVCKLARGWVFKTEYIKNASAIYALNTYDVCNNEQFKVDSVDNLVKAVCILQNRINKYHMKNGVVLVNPTNTYIECNVNLQAGAIIEPFVSLKGTTVVGENSKVCANSTLEDSTVGTHSIIKSGSTIIRSAILDNAIVGSKCYISNKSVVGEEVIVSAGSILDGTTTMKNGKIGINCTLINTKLASGVTIGDSSKCLGSVAEDVKIGSGATIGTSCVINAGVYIKADYTLADGKVANKE